MNLGLVCSGVGTFRMKLEVFGEYWTRAYGLGHLK
jgi:hypothetical protein